MLLLVFLLLLSLSPMCCPATAVATAVATVVATVAGCLGKRHHPMVCLFLGLDVLLVLLASGWTLRGGGVALSATELDAESCLDKG